MAAWLEKWQLAEQDMKSVREKVEEQKIGQIVTLSSFICTFSKELSHVNMFFSPDSYSELSAVTNTSICFVLEG